MIKKATLGEDLMDKMKKILVILVGYQLFNSATLIVIFRNPIAREFNKRFSWGKCSLNV